MGVLLNRRRYMGASKQAKTLFEMHNQYFDGTVNSVVDTGLKLWDGTHNRWKMKAVYQSLNGQAGLATLFTVRPDSSPYSGIRLRSVDSFDLTLSDSWNIIKNDGGFSTYINATYGNALRKNAPLDYDSLTIIRNGNTLSIDYNGYTATIQITDPKTNNLNLLIGCDYKSANNETQRYYTGTVQKFVVTGPPATYDAEIEYLESTGTQWIDTGVIPSRDLSFHCVFLNSGNDDSGYGNVFGARYASNNNEYQLTLYNSGSVSIGTRNSNLGIRINEKNDVSFNGSNTVSVNGVDKSVNTSNITQSTGTIVLFAIRNGGSVTQMQAGRIYSCSLGSVRDFIPVRVGQTGYMYDKVSGQLFGNSGTGDFILGPDKT